ncbi:hypothetical protein D3C80_1497520 [compost metagenome]
MRKRAPKQDRKHLDGWLVKNRQAMNLAKLIAAKEATLGIKPTNPKKDGGK